MFSMSLTASVFHGYILDQIPIYRNSDISGKYELRDLPVKQETSLRTMAIKYEYMADLSCYHLAYYFR